MYSDKIKIVGILLLLQLVFWAQAQQPGKTYVFAHNKGAQNGRMNIEIKWFTEKIETPGGVYLYRQENNSDLWVLMNERVIKPMPVMDPAAKKRDEDLEFYEELLRSKKTSQLNGLMLLSVWVKSFESQDLARFLGIYYKDSTAVEGRTYRYKAVQLISGGPKEIGVSKPVVAHAQETLEAPVQGIQLKPAKKRTSFLWELENERFWAVNVYRRKVGEAHFVKVNKKPVMFSEAIDSSGNVMKTERMYEDDSLEESVTYDYRLCGVDFFGYETQPSAIYPAYIKDLTPPDQPHLKLDSVFLLKVYMSYTTVSDSDLKGYYIYRSTTSEGLYERLSAKPFNKSMHVWEDSVRNPSPYYYFISAVDTSGNESASERIIANVEDVFEPAKPVLLSVKGDTGRIQLTWKANTEQDLWGYYVYRGINGSKLTTVVLLNKDPYSGTSYTDTINKAALNRFFYFIRAVDSSYNRSVYSDTLSASMPDIIPPARPFIKEIKTTPAGMRIVWIANYEKDLQGYHVYIQPAGTAERRRISKELLPLAPCEYLFTPEQYGKMELMLTATDNAGNESALSTAFAYTYKPAQNSASAVLKLNAKKKEQQIQLSWKYEGKQPVKGYVLYRRKETENEFRPLGPMLKMTNFKDKPKEASIYTYEVRLYFDDGTFIRSNQESILSNK